jgi:hypothetical protein
MEMFRIFKITTFDILPKSCPEITSQKLKISPICPKTPKNTLPATPPYFAAIKAIWSRSNDEFRPIRLLLSELSAFLGLFWANNKRTTFWGFCKSCDFEDLNISGFLRFFDKNS